MQSAYFSYVLALWLTALLGGFLAAFAGQRWKMSAARPFALFMGCVAWWGFFAAMSAVAPRAETAVLFGVRFRFTGVILVAPASLLFAATYSGRTEWLRPRRVGLLLVVPVVTLLLNWTADFHDLFVYDVVYKNVGGIWLRSEWSRGVWFTFVHNPYSFSLLICSLGLLGNEIRRTRYPYRQQVYLVFFGALVPLAASVPATFDLLPGPDLDIIVLGFLVMGVTVGWGLSRYQLLEYDADCP